MPYSYLSLDEFKLVLSIADDDDSTANDNRRYRRVLEGISRDIDNKTNRTFQPYTATRYFTAAFTGHLKVPDLLTVTSIKTDNNNDGTYERTWDTDDYELLPFDAADRQQPYTRIEITDTGEGNETFPTVQKGVEVVGVWGYWQETESVGTLNGAISDTTGTSLTMADGHSLEALQTVLIDSEQMYVTDVQTNAVTVYGRGMNGTTAATHSDGATVSVYRYPYPVTEAASILAVRILRRPDAPYGVTGMDNVGMQRLRPDRDVQDLLAEYQRYAFGAA